VTLIGLDEGSKLSGLQRIVENDANPTEGDADDGNEDNDAPSDAGDSAE
jgi:DNA gyrase subunit A